MAVSEAAEVFVELIAFLPSVGAVVLVALEVVEEGVGCWFEVRRGIVSCFFSRCLGCCDVWCG